MPELPEVETVKSGLEQNVIGKEIVDIKTSDKNLRFPFPKNLSDLKNSKIILVQRRARYLLINLDNNKTLLVHLGMSGKLNYFDNFPNFISYDPLVDTNSRRIVAAVTYGDSCDKKNNIIDKDDFCRPKKHDHVFILFSDGSGLIYNDTRRFGFVDVVENNQINSHKMIKNLGVEPLSDDFNAQYLAKFLKTKSMNIKTTMMDNKIVVGVGNIYINESLFLSGISPIRAANSLKKSEIELLVKNIKEILVSAIKAGGSTLRDYVDLKGDVGEFQFDFKVYGKHNKNCLDCQTKIQRIKQNGRSSFYCSKCQK